MFISNYKNICIPYLFTRAFILLPRNFFYNLHCRCRANINACPICFTHSRFFLLLPNSVVSQNCLKFALLLKLYEPNIVKQHKICLICLYNETWSKKERLFLFLTMIRNEYIFTNVTSFLPCDDIKSTKVWKNSLNKKKYWWHHVSLWFEQAFV